LELSAGVQGEWTTAYWRVFKWSDNRADADNTGAVARSCQLVLADDDNATLENATRQLFSARRGDPVLYGRLLDRAPDFSVDLGSNENEISWSSTTGSGNSALMVLRFANPSTFIDAGADFQPGTACPFNPATDVYLSGELFTTNSGSAAAVIRQRLQVRVDSDTAIQVVVTANYVSGPTCTNIGEIGAIGVSSSTREPPFDEAPMAAGESGKIRLYIILQNFFSSEFPQGNVAVLSRVHLEGIAVTDSIDPDVAVESASVDLTGLGG